MIRLLALTFATTLALLAVSLGMKPQQGVAPPPAQAGEEPSPWSKDAPPPSRWKFVATATTTPEVAPRRSDSPGEATAIERDSHGHFRLTAQVNGQDSSFLVDTGADLVALTRDEAQRLGIFVSPVDFRPILRTASGSADAARVQIASLTVGTTELHNVDAVVVDGLATNLLGQSALRKLGKLEENGDHMVINPG